MQEFLGIPGYSCIMGMFLAWKPVALSGELSDLEVYGFASTQVKKISGLIGKLSIRAVLLQNKQ